MVERKGLEVVFWTALAAFGGTALYLATQVDLDYFDSFNFLLQARRLTDSDYSFVGFDSSRPRSLVILLTLFNLISRGLGFGYPNLTAYHLLMVGVTLGYVLVWKRLSTRLFDPVTGNLTGLFLLMQPALTHYSFVTMTDLLTGALWGWFLLFFLSRLEKFPEESKNKKRQRRYALVTGILGALAGLGKHHLAVVLPVTLLVANGAYSWWGSKADFKKWSLYAMLGYLAAIEVLTRVFGKLGQGVYEHFRQIAVQARNSAAEVSPPHLYWDGFVLQNGWPFIVLAVMSLVLLALRLKREKFSTSQKILQTALGATLIFFLVLSQKIPHKEYRYLFPLFPGIFIFLAAGLQTLLTQKNAMIRLAGLGVLALAMIHPLRGIPGHVKRYRSENIYSSTKDQGHPMWEFINSPGANGKVCKGISACYFAWMGEPPTEIPDDFYYRRYDLEPHYHFYTRKPARMTRCLLNDGDLSTLRRQLGSIDPDRCYVVRTTGAGWKDDLVILKVDNKDAPLAEGEFIHCEDNVCFRARRFKG